MKTWTPCLYTINVVWLAVLQSIYYRCFSFVDERTRSGAVFSPEQCVFGYSAISSLSENEENDEVFSPWVSLSQHRVFIAPHCFSFSIHFHVLCTFSPQIHIHQKHSQPVTTVQSSFYSPRHSTKDKKYTCSHHGARFGELLGSNVWPFTATCF